MCVSVLTDTEAPPDPGPESRGPFSLRKCQLETGNLSERVRDVEFCHSKQLQGITHFC